ncbi:HlyD family secretion protein [Mammaliicoccus sciuri]|uniref:HlyD family secretion protein n=1 Tax=Mammaliicoccus sciuri TaxID=1296 RepID=UPI0021D1D90D|nr:HlyD family secretion protein [Mammaliicoccus sciuri]UXU84304.1 HlyD family secretion protein [Mammaliicoccus sciuri]UXU94153.1 HlyD family secretion protein [Mammaliicoccus sciuri]UXV16101.1 HlyD family secretion protein [Mammaliicoccus sciuri]UXV24363.1 HlyD family secretion protein [Mammaliicoccus sciuri]UXV27146.1 HlyD family secretion protein [Mammaliicoccus sciuri]
MKKLYSFEDFQDSSVYLNRNPSKFITRSLLVLFILSVAIVISLFFIKKTDYIKTTAIISPKSKPTNIIAENDIKVNKTLKQNGNFVRKEERVIDTQEMNSDIKLVESKIKYKKDKLDDLSLLYDKIENYPLESDGKLHTDYTKSYFESYKKQYTQVGDLQYINIKTQNLQTLSEKMDALKDEIYDLSSVGNEGAYNYVNKNGYIFYPEDVQEGLLVPKGNVLYQIYSNKYQEVIAYVSSEDILNVVQNQRVSIKLKTKKDEFLMAGRIKYISKFPEESKNNEKYYKIKVSLKNKLPKELENIYFLKGTAFIELEKETISQYLYRKIKE